METNFAIGQEVRDEFGKIGHIVRIAVRDKSWAERYYYEVKFRGFFRSYTEWVPQTFLQKLID